MNAGSSAEQKRAHVRRRSRARRLAMQALYQWQLNPLSITDLKNQYKDSREYADADPTYFAELLSLALHDMDDNDACLVQFADRPVAQIDPLEKAILMVALTELRNSPSVPYKVVINEAVELAKRFGALDGHKYVNAIVDRAARELRKSEQAPLS